MNRATEILAWCEKMGVDPGRLLEKYWEIFLINLAIHEGNDEPTSRSEWQLDDLWELIESMEAQL